MSVASGDEAQCFGKCLNGGVCKQGKCECKPGYSGEFCESAPGILPICLTYLFLRCLLKCYLGDNENRVLRPTLYHIYCCICCSTILVRQEKNH